MHYVINNGYGGGMLWALDLDDFNGVCATEFPLLKSMDRILKRNC